MTADELVALANTLTTQQKDAIATAVFTIPEKLTTLAERRAWLAEGNARASAALDAAATDLARNVFGTVVPSEADLLALVNAPPAQPQT